MKNNKIVCDLLNMQDIAYRDFHSRLVPSVDYERIIGVRTPHLRKYAKDIKYKDFAIDFLNSLPHYYYEENNLHSFLLESIKEYDTCIELVNKFLFYVDNWATCDSLNPKCFKNNLDKLHKEACRWINSGHTYKIRFGIVMLMKYYLDDLFDFGFLQCVLQVENSDYYVYMAKAWYLAEALIKQYDVTIKYFEKKLLSKDVHNKAIQKAIESYRISDETKKYLKTLKY